MAMRTAPRTAPAEPPAIDDADLADDGQELDEEEPGRGLTRGVMLAGLALGGTLVTYMYSDRIHPRLPGVPAALGSLAGLPTVILLVLAAATARSSPLPAHPR